MTHAFFDLDGTIFRHKSMMLFERYYLENAYRFPISNLISNGKIKLYQLMEKANIDRQFINRFYYTQFRGKTPQHVRQSTQEWFKHTKALNPDIYIPEALTKIKFHKQQGHKVVIVSGSFKSLVDIFAEEIDADDVLATELIEQHGVYTGRIRGFVMIGDGKEKRIKHYADINDINLSDCYAYGDHITDYPMLNAVGKPCVVKGDPGLDDIAESNNWDFIVA